MQQKRFKSPPSSLTQDLCGKTEPPAYLQEGWVIANHILVSFHIAFISSVLALPSVEIFKGEVLRFIFFSPETIISAIFMYISFHSGIALHEMGHFLTAAKLNALNDRPQDVARHLLESKWHKRLLGLIWIFLCAPFGRAIGIRREGLNYYPDAPYNFAVAAAGPRMSRNVALITLPAAVIFLSSGLVLDMVIAIYLGRLCLGIGIVSLLDFLLADPGKYREFRKRERRAQDKAAFMTRGLSWWEQSASARRRMLTGRIQEITHPQLGPVTAAWQFRNCGMGGRHTEKEYPESNISMQEAMFLILGAYDYQEAQEMTVRLQNRLKEIIEKAEGCRVMGIGLEGGIAPYVERGEYPLPELRLWAMMKQAIEECGYRPGADVAIALDPAMSELEIAYRKQFKVPDSVGMYLFWRDKALTVMDREGILDIYLKAIQEFEIPILSIEDGFSEDDFEGWKKLLSALGDRIFVIGDDLVTTKDATIELAASKGLINTVLIKANQIGTLYETILAMLVALGKGMELVVSHRSKSPNDDMEAQVALAVNALGLKAGGGANTERLVKYHAVTELMQRGQLRGDHTDMKAGLHPVISTIYAYEEPTNAGVPTVGAAVEFLLPDTGVSLKFRGATPLGTSAGTGEAIHLVDAAFEYAEHREVIDRHPTLFVKSEPGVYTFESGVDESRIKNLADEELSALFERAQRYEGKGCLNAVDNVRTVIAPALVGRIASELTLKEIDRTLLSLEFRVARRRGKINESTTINEQIQVMQRKQNLGMNAMLSVSLAMARGLAHLRGQNLFELIREEILGIIEKLAHKNDIKIGGSRFSDYVDALQKVNQLAEDQGKALHEVLRDVTDIYCEADSRSDWIPLWPKEDLGKLIPDSALKLLKLIVPKLGRNYQYNVHHGLRHTYDLLARATDLASRLKVQKMIDWRILAAAICFHDLASAKEDHDAEGAALAREVLTAAKIMSSSDIEHIEEAIRLHQDYSDNGVNRRTAAGLEAQILYDVNQLDAFGVKGVYRYITIWTQRGSSFSDILEDAQSRFKNLSFKETRELASADFAFTNSFFKKFSDEKTSDSSLLGATGVVNWIRDHPDDNPIDLADRALRALENESPSRDRSFAIDFFKSLRKVYTQENETALVTEIPSEPAFTESLVLTTEEKASIKAVNHELFKAYRNEVDILARNDILHKYVIVKQNIARRTGRFGIVNNRIFMTPKQMFIPYLVGNTLVVHSVHDEVCETVLTLPASEGTILTDGLLKQLAAFEGNPIDLEDELFNFDATRAVSVRIGRIRDIFEQLQKINESANRNEAVYILRILVARLSLFSFKHYLNVKNLQSEVHNLFKELVRFINTPLSRRLPFLVRILVRNIAAFVTKPKLIDRLWNDTIDLAEIHIRGSDIVNELRRSTHHAIGRHTQKLAQAYLRYLDTGETEDLAILGYPVPAQADEEARRLGQPKQIVERIVEDLQQLLGNSETIARIREWQNEYESTLVRCEFGKSLTDEMDSVLQGIKEGNRWVYYHHLRIIRRRIIEFTVHLPIASVILSRLDALLELKPDDVSFDPEPVEKDLRSCVEQFIQEIQRNYQVDLFNALESFLRAYGRSEFHMTFTKICQLRKSLRDVMEKRAFPEHRLMLFQLDCLLEEMGYLALRQIASEYEEKEIDFAQCLDIIDACVQNLTHDGLHSRQLGDLARMLRDKNKTFAEVRNVIEQIHRNYHHIIQRVITPFERARERIEFSEEDLRIALANMQRYMHDVNSIATFTDMAKSYIDNRVKDYDSVVGAGLTSSREPFDVIHLSHSDEIKQRVESDNPTYALRDLYGGKGSGLIYISYLNVPTRDGFILPTTLPQSGALKNKDGKMEDEILKNIKILEADIAKRDGVPKVFGDPEHPLLLAVRGGSVFSMPGMLSTVLFVGMNDNIVNRLAKEDPWCAYDSYRRFLSLYGKAVWGIDMESYNIVEDTKNRYNVKYKYDLPWEGMKEIVDVTKNILCQEGYGEALEDILRDPVKQLFTSVHAVFSSWDSEAVRRYREIKGICDSWQTAVIIQEMAMGNRKSEEIRNNMDETRASLTGVIPRTRVTDLGMRSYTGDFKFSAAGDDLVGGLTKSISFRPIEELASYMPFLSRRLRHTVAKLRRFMGTDQEVEFTVERGVLSILQSRAAEIGKNLRETAFKDPGKEAACGIGIRGGAFRGIVAFDKEDVEELSQEDLSKREDVDGIILVLESPAPEHIPLVLSADAFLSSKGGSTSHAAIAVNGIENRDFTAVMSAAGLNVNAAKHKAVIVDEEGTVLHEIRQRDVISIHGTMGSVYVGTRSLL